MQIMSIAGLVNTWNATSAFFDKIGIWASVVITIVGIAAFGFVLQQMRMIFGKYSKIAVILLIIALIFSFYDVRNFKFW